MNVVPYSPEHADELRAICVANAGEHATASEESIAFTLAMYCNPYLEHGVAYMLVDEANIARGYVFACEDWDRWATATAAYRKQVEGLGPEYAACYNDEATFYASVSDRFPAHLHIDIEEPYTGHGNGRKLMEALLARLRMDGVRGVVLGVAASNTRAVRFYERMGFEKLGEYDEGNGYTFCMALQ